MAGVNVAHGLSASMMEMTKATEQVLPHAPNAINHTDVTDMERSARFDPSGAIRVPKFLHLT
jgi:hypothetical protein